MRKYYRRGETYQLLGQYSTKKNRKKRLEEEDKYCACQYGWRVGFDGLPQLSAACQEVRGSKRSKCDADVMMIKGKHTVVSQTPKDINK